MVTLVVAGGIAFGVRVRAPALGERRLSFQRADRRARRFEALRDRRRGRKLAAERAALLDRERPPPNKRSTSGQHCQEYEIGLGSGHGASRAVHRGDGCYILSEWFGA